MSELIKNVVLQTISKECYEKYFYEMNFFDVDCFKILLSKGLGCAIIAGSLGVKVPQILKIWKAKSAEGLNLFSIFLDLFAITFNLSYSYVKGFPFTAWGDVSFLALQTVIVASLVLTYTGGIQKALVFITAYLTICYVLMGGTAPVQFLWSMQGFNIPIIVLGKLSQAYTNFQNGSTGQLSVITCFLLFFGSLARIFTSIQETGDTMMIMTYCFSAASNGVLVAQCIYYWNAAKGEQPKVTSKAAKTKSKSKKVD
ncbi:mannose-P-dolichol utilization defect 1 protein homolog [Bradysia coprophila]|uniref:mannose-P-dolichol utilization defect 1 protein homolog n=1 Tax=Bradysia coprophila TaxID=38358 RepID=UPI00187DAC02|nr:mannose-P-dolichol utilization defect 1 protein homolog [Bradysia coprophila]